jgi:glucosylceramidase
MIFKSIAIWLVTIVAVNCSSGGDDDTTNPPITPPDVTANEMDFWLTTGNKSNLLEKQTAILSFINTTNNYPSITVNESQTYQTIDGFGFSLTGGSAEIINQLSSNKRTALLQELFGTSADDIGVSYLRISIGASDLNETPFSYDDVPEGQTDETLSNFSLEKDLNGVIAVLKDILQINPNVKILGSPWSAPVWMKDNNSTIGGSLQPQYNSVYAQYFVKYIQEMKNLGITVDAITIQNEPQHGGNNPSMVMSAQEQANFIKNHLGPAFANSNLTTKIIIWDHNCDLPEYPIEVLNDPDAYPFIDGSAFHLYAGNISVLTTVHNSFPNKNLYFTEQYTSSSGDFAGDLKWHSANVIIGSMRNWSKNALEWNLANDANFGPHTEGGCTVCKGAITVNSSESFSRNVSYYIIAHASKFVPQGSTRIGSTIDSDLNNVAFLTPNGKKVLIVENDSNARQTFNIKYDNEWVVVSLDAGAVGTYIWE